MWLLLDLTHQTDGKPAFIRKETATLSDSRNLTQLCSRVQEESEHVSGAERGASAERAKYSRSAERVFIQRPERSLCLAPVPLRYRSHHEPRACTNPPRIHLCLQQLTKLSAYTLQKSFVVKERWSS